MEGRGEEEAACVECPFPLSGGEEGEGGRMCQEPPSTHPVFFFFPPAFEQHSSDRNRGKLGP